MFSRHGGKQHPSWLYKEKGNHTRYHINHDPSSTSLKPDQSYVLFYIKTIFWHRKARGEFLQRLGGQSSIRCRIHGFYLVKSYEKKKELIRKCKKCGETQSEFK